MRCWVLPHLLPAGTIEYRGQTIRLSKFYFDYDDYKNDPDNIAPDERERVADLVRTAPIPRNFSSRKEMIQATFEIGFPGYGHGQFGEEQQRDGSVLTGYFVEIPGANQDRVFVFTARGGAYTLLDDFRVSSALGMLGMRREGDDLVFHDFQKRKVLRRPVPPGLAQ
jgi:hypothetical protein